MSPSRRTLSRRFASTLVCLWAGSLLLPAQSAFASTVERDEVDSNDVTFVAGPGEANQIVVREEPVGVRFIDTGAVISTRTCVPVTPHEALCLGLTDTLIVEAQDGNDTIDARAAPLAFAVGGPGDDVVIAARASGGEGSDRLLGTAIPGQLHGGPDRDEITAGPAGDELFGGAGNDTLIGGQGGDRIWGGEAPCAGCVQPAQDDDVVRAGAGDDVLQVQAGNDRLDGQTGNDTYVIDTRVNGLATTIADSGGDSRDRITIACAGVRLSLTGPARAPAGRYTVSGGTVTFSGIDGTLPCSLKAVPRVIGLTLPRARAVLAAAGFRAGKVSYRRSASIKRGIVILQSPRATARVRVGSRVSLVVSSGRR